MRPWNPNKKSTGRHKKMNLAPFRQTVPIGARTMSQSPEPPRQTVITGFGSEVKLLIFVLMWNDNKYSRTRAVSYFHFQDTHDAHDVCVNARR